VLARDGTPLRAFAAADGVWRYPTTPSEVSPLYLEALLGYEDRWFRWHVGVNPLALGRASVQAMQHGEIVSGGSTLTMQVARLIEPTPRTALGKLRQMVRALQLELRLSKDEILTLYLDLAPFGGNVVGVQAASWAYLGKPANRLSRAEAALLAVLPQAPSRLRPDRHPADAKAARDKVLGRLADLGIWSAKELEEAQLEPVVARRLRPPMSAALLAERLHRERPDARVIESTIDPQLQVAIERRVTNYLSRLPPKTSAAVLVVDNDTLESRVYVGSGAFGDPERLGHVDMAAATRSPGSTLKPFLYGLALDEGLIHSESLLVDAPQSFDGYRPANFGDTFNGPVSAADALRLSLNVPAVDLLQRVTPQKFAARLRHAGVELQMPAGAEPNLAMILGGAGTTLEQLVGSYTSFGREGVGGHVRLVQDEAKRERRVLSRGAAWIVRAILEAHPRPGDSVQGLDLSSRPRLAWKTGTSYGFRDSWAIGVTPHRTIGVWLGRPDGTPMPGQYGAATALPLLFALVDSLPRTPDDITLPALPPEVAKRDVCWPLGLAFDPAHPELCQRKREAWVLDGVVPPTLHDPNDATFAAFETTYLADADGARLLPGCAGADTAATSRIARWPTLAQPWLRPGEIRASTLPALASGCGALEAAPTRALRIDGIAAGTTLRRAPNSPLPPVLDLKALGADGPVAWLVDGQLVGESTQPLRHRFDHAGEVRIVALDRRGAYDSVELKVID
ncbi:MAG TPA: penicillin-binding protein 1C, partial [Xanthomonadales bacterium]|nr:penicillin-binding protein 1C [Xanthomonadales bacterium]